MLASASPRRAELLRAAGFEFDIVVTDVDESIRDGEPPKQYVRRLAAEKSASAWAALKGCATDERDGVISVAQAFRPADDMIVLAADTTVVIDGEILAKPADDAEAAAMLRRLSGRRHEVMTGVSLRRGVYEVGRVETTSVEFLTLSDEDVAWYVASGEGRDKAGAYAIQGLASRFIPRIEGSYSNVVGLPVACVVELLREISGTRPGYSARSASDED
jgi:nucleoside triphosphate pyrophosphatase